MLKSKATGVGLILGAALGTMGGFAYGSTSGPAVGLQYFIGGAMVGAALGALLGWYVGSPKTA